MSDDKVTSIFDHKLLGRRIVKTITVKKKRSNGQEYDSLQHVKLEGGFTISCFHDYEGRIQDGYEKTEMVFDQEYTPPNRKK